MLGRFAGAAALFVTVVLAGCGGGSAGRPGSSASVASRASASRTIAASSETRAAEHRQRSPTSSVTSASNTSSAAGAPRASTSGTIRSAPPPTPAGTPPAPPGLAPSAGYGTYELCADTCSGSVPPAIRRPLHLPAGSEGACPVSAGGGPVRPSPSRRLTSERFIGSAWLGARVTWTAARGYTGPVLIRGRRLGSPGVVGFGEGHAPYDELQLLNAGQSAPRAPGGGRAWLTLMRVKSAGCYADQIDGTGFSSVVVFEIDG